MIVFKLSGETLVVYSPHGDTTEVTMVESTQDLTDPDVLSRVIAYTLKDLASDDDTMLSLADYVLRGVPTTQ